VVLAARTRVSAVEIHIKYGCYPIKLFAIEWLAPVLMFQPGSWGLVKQETLAQSLDNVNSER
jgi:hypothetical protein